MLNGKIAVLVVEDDQDISESYKDILTDAGMELFLAEDGIIGLEQLEKNKEVLDIVMLDLMMPGMDGLEFLSQSRENPDKYGKVKILVISALSSENIVKEVFKSGASGYLLKSDLTEADILSQIHKITGL